MEDKIEKLENRVCNLEEFYNNINLRTTVLENAIIKIDKNTDAIFTELKDFKRLREEDHYIKPLDKMEKLKSQLIGILIGFFAAAFLSYIFPQLGGH